jgi:pimeloyl-ACP methyl ester carboxylesterase
MLNMALLPATEPGDKTFGLPPDGIPARPDVSTRQVRYPTQVWYNTAVREEAVAQIRAWGVSPVVLVGFSKSGLGAWNIARAIPNVVSAIIVFDAPVARRQRPPWGTEPFYADDRAWQSDLPICTAREWTEAMPASHRLILVSGASFHGEMRALSQALWRIGHKHSFLDRPAMEHRWDSGWIEEALHVLLDQAVDRDTR